MKILHTFTYIQFKI